MNLTLSEQLETLHPDIIRDFRRTGQSNAIATQLQAYIVQLDRAIEVYNIEKNITRAGRVLNADYPDLSLRTCKDRIYDAINYFHLNNTVKEDAWCNLYADHFENLSKLAISMNNITEARRCAEKAAQYRMRASVSNINPDKLKPKDMLLSPDISYERLGLEKFNLQKLWTDTTDLLDKIDDLDTRQRSKLKKEAAMVLGITETETEDIDYEDLS